MCIGMAEWLGTIGRIDIAYTLKAFNCFKAAPCERQLQGVLHLWGSLKQFPSKCLQIDPRDPIIDMKLDEVNPNLFAETYPDAGGAR